MNANLRELGARPLLPLQLGDENTAQSDFGSLVADFNMWKRRVLKLLLSNDPIAYALNTTPINLETSTEVEEIQEIEDQEEPLIESDSDEEEKEEEVQETVPGKEKVVRAGSGLVDLEDLGHVVQKARKKIKEEKEERANGILKEMVTPELRKALTKQGYKLIGSHSGVKLCRWTKSMLRGRGGCYKHTFYGIASHQCMEATPSLACANKCVFCWRYNFKQFK